MSAPTWDNVRTTSEGGAPVHTDGTDGPERWYSVSDVARRFAISERTLRDAIAAGHLQVVRPAGLRRGRFPVIRIPASSLTAWLTFDGNRHA
jgi:excisionase family DNA binding protein